MRYVARLTGPPALLATLERPQQAYSMYLDAITDWAGDKVREYGKDAQARVEIMEYKPIPIGVVDYEMVKDKDTPAGPLVRLALGIRKGECEKC